MKEIGFLVIMLLVLSINYGADLLDEENKALLNAMGKQLECRAQFNMKLLENSKKYYSDQRIDQIISQINKKTSDVLKETEKGNIESYRSKRTELLQEFKNSRNMLQEINQNMGKDKNQQERIKFQQNMREEIKLKNKELEDCINEQRTLVIQKEFKIFKGFIESGTNIIEQMKNKGYETSELENILENSKKIISNLEEKINNKKLTVEEKNQIRENEWAELLDLRARFHAMRLKLYAERIGNDYPNYTKELKEVEEYTNKILSNQEKKLSIEKRNEAIENLRKSREKIRLVVNKIMEADQSG